MVRWWLELVKPKVGPLTKLENWALLVVFLAIEVVTLGYLLAIEPSVLPSKEVVNYSRFRSLPVRISQVQARVNLDFLPQNTFSSSPYRLVIDVSENKEFVYKGGELMREVLVSTGSATRYEVPYYTPLGRWKVISKEKSSGAYGPYFLRLALWGGERFVSTAIGLHGTNEPELLGQPASHGCIRHSNQIIEEWYSLLPIGTIVETVE